MAFGHAAPSNCNAFSPYFDLFFVFLFLIHRHPCLRESFFDFLVLRVWIRSNAYLYRGTHHITICIHAFTRL